MKKTGIILILALSLSALSACGKKPPQDDLIRTLSPEQKAEIEAKLDEYLDEVVDIEYETVTLEYGEKPYIYEIHVTISEEDARILEKDLSTTTQLISDDFDGVMADLADLCREEIEKEGIEAEVCGIVWVEGREKAFRTFTVSEPQ